MRKKQPITLEWWDIEIGKMYWSKEERSYFVIREINDFFQTAYSYSVKLYKDESKFQRASLGLASKILDDDSIRSNVHDEPIPRDHWEEQARKGPDRTYIYAYMVPKYNNDVARQIMKFVFRDDITKKDR